MTMITPSAQLTLTKGNKSWSSTAVAAALELVDPLALDLGCHSLRPLFFFFFFFFLFFCGMHLTIKTLRVETRAGVVLFLPLPSAPASLFLPLPSTPASYYKPDISHSS
eukprot:FR741140.1.p2 GENE.FR741140.1~~FR741140.1.p2  ORF type:complete len:109 (-),score=34.23 FR741140.1:393-719(-)